MMKTKKGFTLAEVLTTLMVIGVVAAMTIPTLLNSTSDQQLKVAYKKAMSVLGQGVQLMVAKEEECDVQNDADLARCFATKVLSGSLVQGYASSGNTGGTVSATASDNNTVVTSDGIAYSFYFSGTADSGYRSLEDICDTMAHIGSGKNGYTGAAAKCFVVVDLNGLSKGAKRFGTGASSSARTASDLSNSLADVASSGTTPAQDGLLVGAEQQAILITGTGVRPMAFETTSTSTHANDGWQWMYGKLATGSYPWTNVSTATD